VRAFLAGREVGVGDYVLVHAGFALQKVDYEAAQESLNVISKIIEDVSKEMEAELSS
jgi:hydrogenase expression/formation protein HypC